MRLFLLTLAIIAFAGCSGVQQDAAHLQQEQDALRAAIKKIKVVSGSVVKGNPSPYTVLGPTQGYCFNQQDYSDQVIHGDGIRAAAYRKYGNQVDAIVNTRAWFVADDAGAVFEPYTENGYFECAGTAVHFTTKSVPPAP
jgi:hypothetical protein